MFNEAQVSVVGYVASEPSYVMLRNGIPKLTMRVAWTTRRRDPSTGEWVDGNTSFVRVTCWRRLADNLATCLRKGDPVLLRGRLDVRPFVGKDGQRRISVDVDANALGHDLNRGVAGFRRVWDKPGRPAEDAPAGVNGGGPAGEDAALAGLGLVPDGDGGLVPYGDAGPVPYGDAGLVPDGDGELAPYGDAGLVPDGDGELAPAGPGPVGEDVFDDTAIEAPARDAGSVASLS